MSEQEVPEHIRKQGEEAQAELASMLEGKPEPAAAAKKDDPKPEGDGLPDFTANAEAKPDPKPEPKKDDDPEVVKLRRELDRRAGEYGATLQQLRDQMAAQAQEIERLKTATVPPAPAASAPTPKPEAAPVTDEDVKALYDAETIETYGMPYLRAQVRAMRKVAIAAAPKVEVPDPAKLDERMDQKLQALHRQTAAERAMEHNWNQVELRCPGAIEANANAAQNGFGDYLDGFYGTTKLTRREIARAAFERGDVDTVADVFKGFVKPEPARPRTYVSSPRVDELVTPGRARESRPPDGKEYLSQAKLDAFSREVQANPTKYTPKQIEETIARYTRAAQEGRLVA